MNALGTENDSFRYWGNYWFTKKRGKVSYSQMRNLQCYLNHLYRFIGDKPINSIKPDDIDFLLDNLTEKNPNTQKPTSHQYLVDVRSTASNVFETAIDNDIIAKNPARGRDISKYAPTSARRALTQTEQKLIIYTPHRAHIGALIMMLAGLRRGELIPLTWDDIDLDNFRINITKCVEEKQVNRFELKNGTKTGTWGRIVDIPIDLAIEIEEAKKAAVSKYVCSKRDGSMHSPTSWRQMWQSYIKTIIQINPCAKSTGINEVTAHYLRHTYATLLYISGVDVLTASKLMGHSNIKTTIAIYTHLDEMMVKKSVDNLDDYISTNLFPKFI
jgi:integrase